MIRRKFPGENLEPEFDFKFVEKDAEAVSKEISDLWLP